ncbi:MAG: alpha/beta hydrolase, partial [Rubrivivax sp.]|nr:alpha/beta hydrolase [Rubrivivax sp.]
MRSKALKLLKLAGLVLGVALVTVLGVRIVDTQRGPPLELWHTFVPDELDAR